MKWGDTPTTEERALGKGCCKGVAGCLCAVGFPPEEQCPDCRIDKLRDSYCECPPPPEKFK